MAYDELKRVGEVYLLTGSVIKTAEQCKISEVKARRILITLGLWHSAASDRIAELMKRGYDKEQIAKATPHNCQTMLKVV